MSEVTCPGEFWNYNWMPKAKLGLLAQWEILYNRVSYHLGKAALNQVAISAFD